MRKDSAPPKTLCANCGTIAHHGGDAVACASSERKKVRIVKPSQGIMTKGPMLENAALIVGNHCSAS